MPLFIRNLDNRINRRTLILSISGALLAFVLGLVAGIWEVWVGLVIVGAVFSAILFLMFLNVPTWGLYAVLLFLPYEKVGSWELAGNTIRVSWIIGAVWLLSWFVYLIYNLKLRRKIGKWHSLWLAAFVFMAVSLLSLCWAVNLERGVIVWSVTLFTVLVGFVVYQTISDEKILRIALNVIFISTGIVVLFGIYQFIGDLIGLAPTWTGLSAEYTKSVFGFPRLQSVAAEPLYYANYLLIPFGIAGAMFLYRKQPMRAFWWGLFLLMMGGSILLTLSRGGIVGAAAVVLVLIVLGWRKLLQTRVIALILTMAILFGGVWWGLQAWKPETSRAVTRYLSQAVNYSEGPAVSERLDTWTQAWEIFKEKPVFGIGPGNFGPYVSRQPWEAPGNGWLIVNNEPLELLAETGIVGFGLVLIFIVGVLWAALRAAFRTGNQYYKAVLIGGIAALVGIIVQWQTFSILFVMHIWVLLGLLLAVSYLTHKPNKYLQILWQRVWYSRVRKS
ncbi:O-antigen ligase family protein [Patescibacteria group bacterium]